jgi:hypothetical protein
MCDVTKLILILRGDAYWLEVKEISIKRAVVKRQSYKILFLQTVLF